MAPALWIGSLVFGLLALLAKGPAGECDTPYGRQVAAQWLGVRDWLRDHPEFGDLPPAAVAVWGRYLPYGAALGVTPVASAVLDLGMGGRRLIWSSYGGTWRKVRVRYPRLWPRYGDPVSMLLLRSFLALMVGLVLVVEFGLPEAAMPTMPRSPAGALAAASSQLPILAVLLLAYSGYVPLRTVLDLVTTRTITGEVLWVGRWRSRYRSEANRSVPWLEYVAVADGKADRITAWALPVGSTTQPRARDIVTVRVRPWSRRVVALTLVDHAPS